MQNDERRLFAQTRAVRRKFFPVDIKKYLPALNLDKHISPQKLQADDNRLALIVDISNRLTRNNSNLLDTKCKSIKPRPLLASAVG